MGILDKARTAIAKRKQEADRKAAHERSAMDYRADDSRKRAQAFLVSLDLPRALKGSINGGTVSIRHKKKVVVEITFGWNSADEYERGEYVGQSAPFEASWVRYYAAWKPEGAEEYRRKDTRLDSFYPNNDTHQEELGEYLLRVMNDEFDFS